MAVESVGCDQSKSIQEMGIHANNECLALSSGFLPYTHLSLL